MTKTPNDEPQPESPRLARRRQGIEGLLGRIKEKRAKVVARLVPLWTPEEFETLKPLAQRVKDKDLSYYACCMLAREVLPGRSFQAIRTKVKLFVAYGRFNP